MTCPVTFVCKNWKYIALGAAVIIGAKIALSAGCCGKKCCGDKKEQKTTDSSTPSTTVGPCGNPNCTCGPNCKCPPGSKACSSETKTSE